MRNVFRIPQTLRKIGALKSTIPNQREGAIKKAGFGSVESNYDNADDNARLLMNGAFIIEAEDYNYQGGQHVPSASTMPYLGNAYTGLVPTLDVDYFNGPDESAGDVNAYAYGPRTALAAEGTVETKGGGDAVNNEFNRNRGSFTVNANYAIGWGGVGDWQNYTRTFPAGRYAIFSAGAQDGTPDPDPAARTIGLDSTLSKVTNPTAADNSSVGIEGGGQGLTKLGVFQSPTSGAWSSNDLIPLTDETTGAIVEVQLSGTETLRWSNNSNQDMDYLLLYCLDCQDVTRPTMQVARSSGNITITWTGAGFRVQESSNLATWTDVQGATGSPVTLPTSGTHKFYRLIQ
ncbi:MAG TPA: hypothetical protein VM735_11560 [Candidatus Kapabacteria bacterium]|nr:hypothetical protein [Candidatus Kapabacteria bacterium]